MIIYEVNLRIDSDIYEQYLNWLKPHIKQMLTYPGFLSAELLIPVTDEPGDHETSLHPQATQSLTVIYHVKTYADLKNYFNHHAAQMRDDGLKRFGARFSATRRVMDVMESYTHKAMLSTDSLG